MLVNTFNICHVQVLITKVRAYLNHFIPSISFLKSKDQRDLSYLLNERELAQLEGYKEEYVKRWGGSPENDQDAIFFLGDNVKFSYTWSCTSGAVRTFRRNSGFYWIPHRKRWMVAADKLAALGFPVSQDVANMLQIPTPLPLLDPTRGSSVCGNAMHLSNCTVVFLLAITCFGPSDSKQSIDWSRVPQRD